MFWFKKEKKEEKKFSKYEFTINYSHKGLNWVCKKKMVNLVPPMTKFEFEENKEDLTKNILELVKSGKMLLIGGNSYIKGYSFKKVEWFTIDKESLKLTEENEDE